MLTNLHARIVSILFQPRETCKVELTGGKTCVLLNLHEAGLTLEGSLIELANLLQL